MVRRAQEPNKLPVSVGQSSVRRKETGTICHPSSGSRKGWFTAELPGLSDPQRIVRCLLKSTRPFCFKGNSPLFESTSRRGQPLGDRSVPPTFSTAPFLLGWQYHCSHEYGYVERLSSHSYPKEQYDFTAPPDRLVARLLVVRGLAVVGLNPPL
ncbi:hypothetical protein T265_02446 [Opisthorchis viverrini]|uniref:Uncharacterized protein n=1 Tax=Opisthorchis viverrini TaxID=6198 RepID=A0A075AI97_OPIVI|nr:hypothetical protein T265_02446 [Opisthorchis viverrini]KER31254.1 hypothetical protein T265_02446 [Opisthorchis viverrini]